MQLGGEQSPVELAGYQLHPGTHAQRPQAEQWQHDLVLWASRRTDDAAAASPVVDRIRLRVSATGGCSAATG